MVNEIVLEKYPYFFLVNICCSLHETNQRIEYQKSTYGKYFIECADPQHMISLLHKINEKSRVKSTFI